jgi:hypothetical protein
LRFFWNRALSPFFSDMGVRYHTARAAAACGPVQERRGIDGSASRRRPIRKGCVFLRRSVFDPAITYAGAGEPAPVRYWCGCKTHPGCMVDCHQLTTLDCWWSSGATGAAAPANT